MYVYIYVYMYIYIYNYNTFIVVYIHKCKDKLAPKVQRWRIPMVRFTFVYNEMSQWGSSDKLHGVFCFQNVRPREQR